MMEEVSAITAAILHLLVHHVREATVREGCRGKTGRKRGTADLAHYSISTCDAGSKEELEVVSRPPRQDGRRRPVEEGRHP